MRTVALSLALLLAVSAFAAGDLLTPADVEKAGALTGVHKVAKNSSPDAGGELNFAGKDGKLVAIVMISPSMYDYWKKRYTKSSEAVSGVGEEGFRSKKTASTQFVFFRKKGTGVWVQSMGWRGDGSPTLTTAQLTELAKLAALRL
ncbi:MAG: hypothetical protein JOZ54_17910 [Acidobacteria bacterium]|nr:hypothetical protein [Acidobacteriota bacterium]